MGLCFVPDCNHKCSTANGISSNSYTFALKHEERGPKCFFAFAGVVLYFGYLFHFSYLYLLLAKQYKDGTITTFSFYLAKKRNKNDYNYAPISIGTLMGTKKKTRIRVRIQNRRSCLGKIWFTFNIPLFIRKI